MPISDFARSLDALQAKIHTFLKPQAFRKKGRTHNRITADGLVHVINFQMGQYPIGDNYVIPGIRESFYGRFAVNLGVLLPCVYEIENQKNLPDFTQEYNCTIRERLEALAFGKDHWFELTANADTLAATVVELLDQFGLPFLDQFNRYEDVLSHYERNGRLPFRSPARAALDAAIISHYLGNLEKSKCHLLNAHTNGPTVFREHIQKIAVRLNIPFISAEAAGSN